MKKVLVLVFAFFQSFNLFAHWPISTIETSFPQKGKKSVFHVFAPKKRRGKDRLVTFTFSSVDEAKKGLLDFQRYIEELTNEHPYHEIGLKTQKGCTIRLNENYDFNHFFEAIDPATYESDSSDAEDQKEEEEDQQGYNPFFDPSEIEDSQEEESKAQDTRSAPKKSHSLPIGMSKQGQMTKRKKKRWGVPPGLISKELYKKYAYRLKTRK